MVLSKTDFGDLRYVVHSMSPVMEKDEGMGNPITKKDYLRFVDKLEEILMKLDREIENIKRDIEKIKS